MQSISKLLIVFPLVLFMAGCGQDEGLPSQTLEQRIQSRWDSLLEREFEQTWQYQTPGFRETTDLTTYIAEMTRRPVRWLEASLEAVECEESRCQAFIQASYRPVGAPTPLNQMDLSRRFEELWIKVDGEWWYAGE